MSRVRIGIIGCGQIAQHHMRTYSGIPEAEMVACADVDERAAIRSAEEHGIPHTYTDLHEMLERDDLDAVDVCLHNNFHLAATVAALDKGKHVYCEKPMAGSYRDAHEMMQAARASGRKLHIQLSTLYANETRAARELIEMGELGELYTARSAGFRRRGRPYVDGYGTPTFVQKRNSAGGALYDMGVYHIAQMLYLLGNPVVERISGKIYQKTPIDTRRLESSGYDVEELGLGLVRFAGDLTLDLIESWAIHLDKFEGSWVAGSLGGIRLNPFGFYKSLGHLDLNATIDLGSAEYRWHNVQGDGPLYANSQAHWIAALQGRVELMPTAEIALNTMLISEGIYLSDALRREVSGDEVLAESTSTALEV
ncbi:MAG TPA: Gfo/Idh/MocA family oxidoreductase [Fimbriimonadaceae bacterium]|nr:Gfo/Idh/MocA family oxidoreductase [Fimbriimonadaceae bacterium]